ncbi:MAG: class I SAM-dependent methyltransferase [Alphaproteobacteria bacterium]|nr:class I SAM-dependent methyltransferase [Alphaproteobacteria bacterium]
MREGTNTKERLSARLSANTQGSRDMNAFLFELAGIDASDSVLELGCGSGSHTRRLAPLVHSIVATDISEELVSVLSRDLADRPNVQVIACDMDGATEKLSARRFDLVTAVYSLYYSRNVGSLVERIARNLLAENGRFLTISPDIGNNAEWYDDLAQVFPIAPDVLQTSGVSRRIVGHVLDNFAKVTCVRFVNEVRYLRLADVMAYYDGCGAYCPAERRGAAERYFARKFEAEGSYSIFKRALAILARDGTPRAK